VRQEAERQMGPRPHAPQSAMEILWMCLAMLVPFWLSTPGPASGEVRLRIIETDPSSPATLGHWHRFNVHFAYESDRPIRVHGEAYWDGRKVTSATGGSPVYPTGTGDGMFWFAYTEPAQVNRIGLTAYGEHRETPLARTVLDVELRWTGEKTPRPAGAAWVQQMDAEAERRQQIAYQAYMNRPIPVWQWGMFYALIWSPIGYLVVQIVLLRRFHGGMAGGRVRSRRADDDGTASHRPSLQRRQ
jgi:hypothetical protein